MELGATSALIKKNIFFLKIAPKNVFYKKMFNTLVPLVFYFHILYLKNQDPVKLNTLLSYFFFHITYAETGKQKRKWPIFLCFLLLCQFIGILVPSFSSEASSSES